MNYQDILLNIPDEQIGTILEINSSLEIQQKLSTLGIGKGSRIKKVSGGFLRGPVVVETNKNSINIGNVLAQQILIEIEN